MSEKDRGATPQLLEANRILHERRAEHRAALARAGIIRVRHWPSGGADSPADAAEVNHSLEYCHAER